MKVIRIVLGLLLTAFLAACGGGGGSAGGNPNQPNLVTMAGSAVTLMPGAVGTYGISGGVPPYRVGSSDTAVSVAGVNGNVLFIGGIRPGVANIGLFDYANNTVSIAVTVGASRPLETTAPPAVTLALGAEASQVYRITGGVAPYTATSDNPAIASGTVTGDLLRLTALTNGSAKVVLRDDAGATVSITVTAGSATSLFTTAPGNLAISRGITSPDFFIGGGSEPYFIASSNPSTVGATLIAPNRFVVQGLAVGGAEVVVTDSKGVSVSVAVAVSSDAVVVPALSVRPSAGTANVGDTLTFLLEGGQAPYSATANNPSVASVSAVVGNSLSVRLNNTGSGVLTVQDSGGRSIQVTVTSQANTPGLRISPSVLAVSVEPEEKKITLSIYGGASGVSYRAFSNNVTLVRVPGGSFIGDSFVITLAQGTPGSPPIVTPVVVTILDERGAAATATINVSGSAAAGP
jgi:hypothetical protein